MVNCFFSTSFWIASGKLMLLDVESGRLNHLFGDYTLVLDVFFGGIFYGLYHGIHHHISPPFGRILLEPFPSIEQANPRKPTRSLRKSTVGR